ncbi:jg7686 [Pararge aegeria aegeria]|uniref:Jg7686 protein n=1 Tax=Pararge aegeria aegeria TaxID=348720 RepID=A0A8S4RXI8_9NEOP|nr:jg7686 [Pararge aegeria aegeria]
MEIKTHNPTIILITETHLHAGINDSLINLPNYTLFRLDRKNKKGGGVAVYTLMTLNNQPFIAKLNQSLHDDSVEALWLDITYQTFNLILACVYRPTHYNLEKSDENLFNSIKKASGFNSNLLIIGDFNLPDIKWPLQKTAGYNKLHEEFVEIITDTHLIQMVTKNTRKRNNQESLLDLILCNDETLISEINYNPPIGKSDHIVLMATIQLLNQATNHTTSTRRAFNYGDYSVINDYLLSSEIPENASIEDTWKVFKDNINSTIDKFIPKIKNRKNCLKNKPWITKEICKLTDIKKKLWNVYLLDQDKDSYKEYRTTNNKIVKITRQSRINFESKIVESGHKGFYAYVRKQISTRVDVPPALMNPQTNIIVTRSVEVAEIFASQFEHAYVCEPPGILPEVHIPRVQASLEDIAFTPVNVRKAIKTFDESTASGPDNIPAILLQKCSAIVDHITLLMNLSFATGKLPKDWKIATVTPIFKKGNKLNAENYRPISLTSILCKATEKIIAGSIREFIIKQNIIIPEQHGFTPKRSTVTNLLSCLCKWILNWDNHQPTDIIYLDYEKAFDRVPISRLVHKLEHLGIRGKLLIWIKDFLNERKFRLGLVEDFGHVLNITKAYLTDKDMPRSELTFRYDAA